MAAIRRRARGTTTVRAFPSGGLDSRAVVLALRSAAVHVQTFNVARPGAQDHALGAAIAERLGTRKSTLFLERYRRRRDRRRSELTNSRAGSPHPGIPGFLGSGRERPVQKPGVSRRRGRGEIGAAGTERLKTEGALSTRLACSGHSPWARHERPSGAEGETKVSRMVEAAGVEPASESTSSQDSTCVSASGFSCPACGSGEVPPGLSLS